MRSQLKALAAAIAAIVLVSVFLAACTPAATIKVTLSGEDGALLKDMTVTVGDKTAKTDASGVATVKGVPPGQVTLKFTGPEYQAERTETVKAGNNEFKYELMSHVWRAVPFADVAKMKLRVTTFGIDDPVMATFARGQGVHWTMPDGSEIISLFDVVYFRMAGGSWQRFSAGVADQAMAEMMAELTNQFLGEYQAFDARISDNLVQAKWTGTEVVNGYDTKVYELTWAAGTQGGNYRAYVIYRGDYRGYVTRYQWEIEGLGTSVFDAYDFGGDFTVKAPI